MVLVFKHFLFSKFSIVFSFTFLHYLFCFVLYIRDDLIHRRPALMAVTFPAAYHFSLTLFL